jgi:hypothetical protein
MVDRQVLSLPHEDVNSMFFKDFVPGGVATAAPLEACPPTSQDPAAGHVSLPSRSAVEALDG